MAFSEYTNFTKRCIYCTAKWAWDSSIFSSIKPKNWHRITCWFLCFYQFLPVFAWYDHNIVQQIKTIQSYDLIMPKLVKTGKNTEFNKQSDVKFWLNWIKFGAFSYLLSCKKRVSSQHMKLLLALFVQNLYYTSCSSLVSEQDWMLCQRLWI